MKGKTFRHLRSKYFPLPNSKGKVKRRFLEKISSISINYNRILPIIEFSEIFKKSQENLRQNLTINEVELQTTITAEIFAIINCCDFGPKPQKFEPENTVYIRQSQK